MAYVWSSATLLAKDDDALVPGRKQFINIVLPSASRFTPLVLAEADPVLVGRITDDGGRDIQVLRAAGQGVWKTLGPEGVGVLKSGVVTLAEGELPGGWKAAMATRDVALYDLVRSGDGVVWMLSAIGRPFRYILLTFRQGHWKPAHPPGTFLRPEPGVSDPRLCWLEADTPSMISWNGECVRLLKMTPKGWVSAPVEAPLKQAMGDGPRYFVRIIRRERGVWIVYEAGEGSARRIRRLTVTGTGPDGCTKPEDVGTLPTSWSIDSLDITPDGRMAVNVRDATGDASGVYIYTAQRDGVLRRERCPVFEDMKEEPVKNLRWSNDGVLHVLCRYGPRDEHDRRNEVHLLKYLEGQWRLVIRHEQPLQEGLIGLPKLFFRPDGTPLAVWNDW